MSALTVTIGQRLGHYRILEKVGAGGMGTVYRAHDERLDRDVALKLLPPSALENDAARRLFRKEALALSRLNHPNIASIYDFDFDAGVDFLVMEFITGVTLASKLARSALSEDEALQFGQQIALALEHAHGYGVVHRDLKPGNVIIRSDGQLKVVDFGLAKLLTIDESAPTESLSGMHGLGGTLPYMPPEQLWGKPPDCRSDIYSAGAVLYEMATGQRPFPGKVPTAISEAILHTHPVSPRQLSPTLSSAFESIILKCLEKQPATRYQTARELSVDLGRARTGSAGIIARPKPASVHRHWVLIASLLAILVVALPISFLKLRAWQARTKATSQIPSIRSLAVLPLENLTHDPEQDYFADGMTDELTTELAHIGALRVVSRTSAMRYKRTTKTLTQITRELQVDAVIEGSVLRSDGSVRINTQLVQAEPDRELWAHSYQRELKDVLHLQGELAHDIAEQIKIKVTPQEERRLAATRTVDPGSHEAYLKGLYHWNKGTEEHYRDARDYFKQAIALDANYAPAYAGLADYFWATDELPPSLAMPSARENVLKALALDDDLVDAHKTLAAIKFFGDWDWVGAEEEFKRALELNSSYSEGHRMYSLYLSALGREEDAFSEIQAAQRLDPLSLTTSLTGGWISYYARQYDRALQQCQAVLELDPNWSPAHECLGDSYSAKGNFSQGIAEGQLAATGHDPVRLAGLGRSYALAGRESDARKILAELNQASKTEYIAPYFFAIVECALGEKDRAFDWLEKGFNGRDPYLTRLRVDVAMDPLRSDARFKVLLQRVGLAN
ncbi:MAG TPA: protein kinase [Candidatus Dormibacteraeota bacterium]|jgi:serine/threonine protein kinase/tetratricopeptide (TPR) repeat protein|nr:protein kinase [Candidatus Dormibacteraeota bacterium]